MKNGVFLLVLLVVIFSGVTARANVAPMPIIWMNVYDPNGGPASSIECGLSDTGLVTSSNLDARTARIAIDDYSGKKRGFTTKPSPAAQSVAMWSVYIWTTPDYQPDIVQMHWSTSAIPENFVAQFWFIQDRWPAYVSVSGNSHSGYLTLPAIKTDNWHHGMYGQVEIWNMNAPAVPEPSSFIALGTGVIGIVGIIRRRRVS